MGQCWRRKYELISDVLRHASVGRPARSYFHPPCADKGCHHHHPLAWISQTLSRHFSLSFIAFGRSSGLHTVSCCMYVRASRPAFAWPCAWVHRSTSLMSSSLLLQQCPWNNYFELWMIAREREVGKWRVVECDFMLRRMIDHQNNQAIVKMCRCQSPSVQITFLA